MKEFENNPLGLENKLYTVEEFGFAIRNKFGGDSFISNVMLGELFLSKYHVYNCNIKKPKDYITHKNCGCC